MNRKIYLAGAALAALSLMAACNKKADGSTDMNPGASAPVNAAQDATSAAVGAGAANAGAMTTDGFVTNAAISDMYELEAAKIAMAKSKNPDIKKFAGEMIKAHTKSSDTLKALLPTSGATVTLPTAMDERHKGLIDNLNNNSTDFDKTYIDQQSNAHREASDLFHGYADHGDNPALKDFAAKTAPVIDEHLAMVKGLDKGGADGTAH